MHLFKLTIPSFRKMLVWLGAFLVRRFKIGWRLAFQDPTPAWKKKGVVHGPSGWVDLTLMVSVIVLALLSLL